MEYLKYAPDGMIVLISLVVQYLKKQYGWEGSRVDALVLVLCLLFVVPADAAVAILTNPALTDISQGDIFLVAYWILQFVLSVTAGGFAYLTGVGFYVKALKPGQPEV